jgi:hypothetical protein
MRRLSEQWLECRVIPLLCWPAHCGTLCLADGWPQEVPLPNHPQADRSGGLAMAVAALGQQLRFLHAFELASYTWPIRS